MAPSSGMVGLPGGVDPGSWGPAYRDFGAVTQGARGTRKPRSGCASCRAGDGARVDTVFHGRGFRQIPWIALAEPISRLKLRMRSTQSVRLGGSVCVACSATLVRNVQAIGSGDVTAGIHAATRRAGFPSAVASDRFHVVLAPNAKLRPAIDSLLGAPRRRRPCAWLSERAGQRQYPLRGPRCFQLKTA